MKIYLMRYRCSLCGGSVMANESFDCRCVNDACKMSNQWTSWLERRPDGVFYFEPNPIQLGYIGGVNYEN